MITVYAPDGVVLEIVSVPQGFTLEQCRHPDYLAHCVEAADDVEIGWTYDGTTFVAEQPLAPSVAVLQAYAALKRYEKEVGGITIGGIKVATDDRSKQMILGARMAASADPDFTTSWVGSDGSIANLNAIQIVGISDAVLQHVQNCFSIFASIKAAIDVSAVTTTAEIDAAFA